MTRDMRKAIDFFRANAGWRVGSKLAGAYHLARAEQAARDAGITFDWGPDDEGADLGDHEVWCRDAERAKREGRRSRCEHSAQTCDARTLDGTVVASLCGIIDATAAYERVVQAELAIEALPYVTPTPPSWLAL